jgi:hypothetical protein
VPIPFTQYFYAARRLDTKIINSIHANLGLQVQNSSDLLNEEENQINFAFSLHAATLFHVFHHCLENGFQPFYDYPSSYYQFCPKINFGGENKIPLIMLTNCILESSGMCSFSSKESFFRH